MLRIYASYQERLQHNPSVIVGFARATLAQ
jgi:hypothetical protein